METAEYQRGQFELHHFELDAFKFKLWSVYVVVTAYMSRDHNHQRLLAWPVQSRPSKMSPNCGPLAYLRLTVILVITSKATNLKLEKCGMINYQIYWLNFQQFVRKKLVFFLNL